MSNWSKRSPKPAGQGSVAPADVQQVNAFNSGSGPSNTANADKDVVANTANNWQDHAGKSNPGGYGG